MNLATIDGGQNAQQDFEKYFKNTDLFELFEYDPVASSDSCGTLKLLLERDGFPIHETPTNTRHVDFLRKLDTLVKGITLNSNLYTNKETHEEDKSESSDCMIRKRALSDSEEPNEKSESDYGAKREVKPKPAPQKKPK